jgi:DNA-binding NarL/FixJ family response regulator
MARPTEPITPAEQRVLAWLCQGLSNKAIAAALVLSPRTIESHVSSLLAKTGCHSRTELLLWSLDGRAGSGDTMRPARLPHPSHSPQSPA